MPFVHHIALSTVNLDRLRDFYVDVLGFELAMEGRWADDPETDAVMGANDTAARMAILHGENCSLELFEFSKPAAGNVQPLRPYDRGYTHFGLLVKDIKAEYDRLVRAGVTFTRAPKNFGKMRAAYGKDPDGNILELLEEGPGMEKWSRRDFVRVSLVDDEGTRDSRHLMAP